MPESPGTPQKLHATNAFMTITVKQMWKISEDTTNFYFYVANQLILMMDQQIGSKK